MSVTINFEDTHSKVLIWLCYITIYLNICIYIYNIKKHNILKKINKYFLKVTSAWRWEGCFFCFCYDESQVWCLIFETARRCWRTVKNTFTNIKLHFIDFLENKINKMNHFLEPVICYLQPFQVFFFFFGVCIYSLHSNHLPYISKLSEL